MAAGVVLAFAAYLFLGGFLKHRGEAMTRAEAARVSGPPCPTLDEAQFQRAGYRGLKGVDYMGAVFMRQYGHVECSSVPDDFLALRAHPVCQFTSPNVLAVTTKRGTSYYAPGVGHPATVVARGDEVQCVMASNFTMSSLRAR